MAGCQ